MLKDGKNSYRQVTKDGALSRFKGGKSKSRGIDLHYDFADGK